MAKVIDMTTGRPFFKILIFSIPLVLNFLLQQIYSLADALIVSLSLGAEATTGVNITGSINFFILGFCSGISAGFGVMTARYVGARDEEALRKTFAHSIMLTLAVGAVLTLIGVLLSREILILMNTDEKYLGHSTEYLVALFSGVIFTMFYNLASRVMNAMGDSRTPLYILVLCAVLNVGLNSLLFLGGLTVGWAGWATVISQAVSALVGFIVIFKKFPELRLKRKDFKVDPRFSLRLLGVGVPMALQFSVTAIGSIIQQGAFNSLGKEFSMAQGAGSRIDSLCFSSFQGLGVTMANYAGQNYGAGDIKRLKLGFRDSLFVAAIYTAFSMALARFASYPLTTVLLPDVSDEIHQMAVNYVHTQSLFYFVLALLYASREPVQAMGMSGVSMFGGVCELLARFIAAATFVPAIGISAAAFSNPFSWLAGALYFLILQALRFRALEKRFGGTKSA